MKPAIIGDLARKVGADLGVRSAILNFGRWLFPPETPFVKQVRIHGVQLMVLANEDVGRRIAMLGRYEPREATLFSSMIRRDDICFDVGANTGYYSMIMASRAPAGQVHAFEPVPINWHLLSLNAMVNDFRHIVANCSALGGREAEVNFSRSVDGAYSSLVAVGRKSEAEQLKVRMESLDAYILRNGVPRVDVIKVDVEGAEELVLGGAERLLSTQDMRPRVAMIEMFDKNLEAYGASIDGILDRMSGYGYEPFIVSTDDGLIPYSPAHRNIYQNVFFTREA